MRAPASLLAIPAARRRGRGTSILPKRQHLPLCAAAGALLALVAGIARLRRWRRCRVPAAVVLGSAARAAFRWARMRRAAFTLLRYFLGSPTALTSARSSSTAPFAKMRRAGPFGVSLLLDVSHTVSAGGRIQYRGSPIGGGVRLTVSGSLALSSLAEWKAGRRVRVTTTLREPAVYSESRRRRHEGVARQARRDPGRIDQERGARERNCPRLGDRMKSLPQRRAWVRRRLSEFVGRWSESFGRHRHRDPDRRPHGPSRRGRAPVAGSGDLSRHRHLGRQHRDPDGLSAGVRQAGRRPASAVPPSPRSWSCSCSTVSSRG